MQRILPTHHSQPESNHSAAELRVAHPLPQSPRPAPLTPAPDRVNHRP